MKAIDDNRQNQAPEETLQAAAGQPVNTDNDDSQCAVRPDEDGEEMVQLGLDSCGD